jgi:hypothetical protein
MIVLHREVLLRKLWGQYKSNRVRTISTGAQPFQDGRGPELTASAVTVGGRRLIQNGAACYLLSSP